MRMKKYLAPTLADAMNAIRAELGPNAVIVHQTEARRGPLALLSRPSVEVVAAVDDRPPAHRPPPRRHPMPVADSRPRARPLEPAAPARPRPPGPAPDTAPSSLSRQQIATLVSALAAAAPVAPAPGPPPAIHHPPTPVAAQLYPQLVDQEVDPTLAQELVARVDAELRIHPDDERPTVRACLARHLQAMLPTAGPLAPEPDVGPTVVFLIGPTGVGKTTTIAKLAAAQTVERRKVALITCDTFRIAAIPQLRTYADILNVPLEVAYTPDELTDHVMKHLDKDLVFVDTPGRSQRNADQLADLRRFVLAVPTRRTFLTVAAGSRYRDMLDVVGRFSAIPFDGLLITKLDETTTYGPLLNLVRQTARPVTYITTGQNVPRDITVATSGGLADLLLDSLPLGAGTGAPR